MLVESYTGHVDIGVIFFYNVNLHCWMYSTQSNADWLSINQSRVLQADWLILENNDKTTLQINMRYCVFDQTFFNVCQLPIKIEVSMGIDTDAIRCHNGFPCNALGNTSSMSCSWRVSDRDLHNPVGITAQVGIPGMQHNRTYWRWL